MGEPKRNIQLEALLAEFGYTHAQLADEVNQVAEELFGKPGQCTDRHVRRWIRGDVQWPWSRYLLPLQEIFGRSPEAMGFTPSKTSRVPTPPPRQRPAPVKEHRPVRRREFIAVGLAAALGLDTIPNRGRLGTSDVERIRTIVPALYKHDHQLGGGALHDVATDALQRVQFSLNHCTYGERVERLLYSAIGDLAASAGWFAYDAGRQDDATRLYSEALQAGMLSGDGMLQARVWSNLAMQARILGRDHEALRIGRAAVDTRQAKADPWLMALLHCRQAVGYARTGERVRAQRSLARAETAYERAQGEPDAWLSFLTPAEITGLAGAAHHALGQYGRAADLTTDALDMLDARFERNRVYYTAQRAQALLDGGRIEEAAAEAARAVESAGLVQSERVRDKLSGLRQQMQRHVRVPAAAEFLEQTRRTGA
ncbi:tetratricopeptide repeat protein [Streptomyces sp. NPDC003753]